MLKHRWATDVVRALLTDGLEQVIRLWEIMLSIQLILDCPDIALWEWHEGGFYTSASTYRSLFKGAMRVSYANRIWK